jgi:hypothetical protein
MGRRVPQSVVYDAAPEDVFDVTNRDPISPCIGVPTTPMGIVDAGFSEVCDGAAWLRQRCAR